MMGTFAGGGAGLLWVLHFLFCLAFLIGLILFIVWIVNVLSKKKQLLPWALGLLAVGIIGILLTCQYVGYGMMKTFKNYDFGSKAEGMMLEQNMEFGTPEDMMMQETGMTEEMGIMEEIEMMEEMGEMMEIESQ